MKVALTFDDGPSEWTNQIIELLAKHDARATFFVCGHAIPGHEHELRISAFDGHEIGNHSYDHPRLTELDDAQVRSQLERTQQLIDDYTGEAPTLWRAPYFATDDRVNAIAEQLGLTHVGATLDPCDWNSTTNRIVDALACAQDGDIIDLHDGIPPDGGTGTNTRQPTVDALEQFLHHEARFVTVSELQ